jgi:hypothetical protein
MVRFIHLMVIANNGILDVPNEAGWFWVLDKWLPE